MNPLIAAACVERQDSPPLQPDKNRGRGLRLRPRCEAASALLVRPIISGDLDRGVAQLFRLPEFWTSLATVLTCPGGPALRGRLEDGASPGRKPRPFPSDLS